MIIEILGTRANIRLTHPQHKKHTGILIDDKILIDVGEPEYLRKNPAYIFITHLHNDHAFFVHGQHKTGSNLVAVYAPEEHGNMKDMIIPHAEEPIHAGEHKVTPVHVHHSARVKSFAYIIEKNKKKIFYTGDVSRAEHNWLEKIGRADMVIIDGSHFRRGGHIQIDKNTGQQYGHTGIPDLVELFRPITPHIVVVHLGSWFVRNASDGEMQIIGLSDEKVKVEPAYDGQTFRI